jgi:hypothetical protein
MPQEVLKVYHQYYINRRFRDFEAQYYEPVIINECKEIEEMRKDSILEFETFYSEYINGSIYDYSVFRFKNTNIYMEFMKEKGAIIGKEYNILYRRGDNIFKAGNPIESISSEYAADLLLDYGIDITFYLGMFKKAK